MKRLTYWLMRYYLKKMIIKRDNETNSVLKSVYNNVVKNYVSTILFLESDLKIRDNEWYCLYLNNDYIE